MSTTSFVSSECTATLLFGKNVSNVSKASKSNFVEKAEFKH